MKAQPSPATVLCKTAEMSYHLSVAASALSAWAPKSIKDKKAKCVALAQLEYVTKLSAGLNTQAAATLTAALEQLS